MTNNLTDFRDRVDDALHEALAADLAPDDLEMILQKRAQDMRELHAHEEGEED